MSVWDRVHAVNYRRLIMYHCNECERDFEQPIEERTSWEAYNGVGSLFPDRHYVVLESCPYCHSGDIEEKGEYEEWED